MALACWGLSVEPRDPPRGRTAVPGGRISTPACHARNRLTVRRRAWGRTGDGFSAAPHDLSRISTPVGGARNRLTVWSRSSGRTGDGFSVAPHDPPRSGTAVPEGRARYLLHASGAERDSCPGLVRPPVARAEPLDGRAMSLRPDRRPGQRAPRKSPGATLFLPVTGPSVSYTAGGGARRSCRNARL